VEGGLLLDVVVGESTTILELLSSENQALLVRGDTLLVLNLGLDIVDGIRGLDLKSDGLAGEGLDEDLHRGNKCVMSTMYVLCCTECVLMIDETPSSLENRMNEGEGKERRSKGRWRWERCLSTGTTRCWWKART
jgi:hypothetical protein